MVNSTLKTPSPLALLVIQSFVTDDAGNILGVEILADLNSVKPLVSIHDPASLKEALGHSVDNFSAKGRILGGVFKNELNLWSTWKPLEIVQTHQVSIGCLF